MKVVIQRVSGATVAVGGEVVGRVQRGLCVLVGIAKDDTPKDMDYVVRKILNLRLFQNPETGKHWDKNVVDIGGGILVVSQFTLCHVLKGNKPDFHNAMGGEQALAMFNEMVATLRQAHQPQLIQTGQFGAYMDVSISNDGPVTIQLNSRGGGED